MAARLESQVSALQELAEENEQLLAGDEDKRGIGGEAGA